MEDEVCPMAHWKELMQVKRFEPAWLKGTSAGEVMFQADYHLKELSMGECEQPVVGMLSCPDICDEQNSLEEEWCAREWFLVNRAEMLITEDDVLIPEVVMGVEAREQANDVPGRGYEDVKIT